MDQLQDGAVRFWRHEDGATAIEYALIVAATGLAIVPFVPVLEAMFTAEFTTIAAGLK